MTKNTLSSAIFALIIMLVTLSIPSGEEIAVDTGRDVVQEIGNQVETPLSQEVTRNALFALDLLEVAIVASGLFAIMGVVIAILKCCGFT